MNRLFNTNYNHRGLDFVLLILRIGIAGLMLSHGIPKLEMLLAGGEIKFMDPIGLGNTATLALAVFAEVICSVLILLGLAVRLAVLPLMVTMLIAIFIAHGNDGLAEKELAIHYLLTYIVLLFAGGGRLSIDSLISQKSARSRRGY
ncbi:putative oxidoreductase [Pedobacter cryoconitis]|uniref:Putative oxidoreductase n=1 Tax=Pedobacter cryoconitis TaxID=188932 RepID=A0A7W9DKP5_9SPHI|nr:DoxX family protein [Pedobacter cryoconitis]MBB5621370.1 putative oxidoreductase [Pedobacter cryoconitis]MBB5649117.1 putative oxidoreductase [Pedobacter cryoconitis]